MIITNTHELNNSLSGSELKFNEINNFLSGYKYLIFFSMLFMSIMICYVLLTNRYVSISKNIFILGGTLTSPFIFILGDIVAEIFGYKAAKQMIWSGFICQSSFAIICELIVHAPYPVNFKYYNEYNFVFSQLGYIVFTSIFAYIISNLINIFIITKWKILLKGRYFWLRSLGSSTIAEAIYSLIAIILMEVGSIPPSSMIKLILTSYLIKVIYSLMFAVPSNVLVYWIKHSTRMTPTAYREKITAENSNLELCA
jgi:uncharacterized integral membrane protein (TIGR00697 family)